MNKLNQKGFSGFEITLLVLVLAALGFAGYTVWQKNKPSEQPQTTIVVEDKKAEENKEEKLPEWERVTSGKGKFSLLIPDGWGEVLKPLDSDLLTIRGEKQPVYTEGAKVIVKPLEAFGTDGPGIFTAIISDNIAEPRGTAVDFKVGDMAGKKYTYVASADTEPGLGQEFKGDKRYDYRFKLNDGSQLVVWYNVYVKTDNKDQVSTVDQIVKSLKLQ